MSSIRNAADIGTCAQPVRQALSEPQLEFRKTVIETSIVALTANMPSYNIVVFAGTYMNPPISTIADQTPS